MSQNDRLYLLTSHLCSACGSRILEGDDGAFHCSGCGAVGQTHDEICFCGHIIPAIGQPFECIKNPNPSPAMPAQVVIRERPVLNEHEIKQSPVRPRLHVADTGLSMIF